MANLASFDLNLLRILDALLRERSTTRAGHRVGLSQPAVSAALGRLRAALDDPLFLRRGQRLEPTDHALSLEAPLREALDRIEALLEGPRFDPATAQRRFRITGSDFFAEMLMPDLAALLSRQAPGVTVQLIDLVPDDYVGTLERYEADLALIPQGDFPGWVEHRPAFRSGFAVIARRGAPALAGVTPGEVLPLDIFCALGHVLFSPEGNLSAMGDAALARVGRQRRVVMTLPVFSGVCSAVAASDHLALLPSQLARAMAAKAPLSIYRPPVEIAPAQIAMVWRRRAGTSAGHRWLREKVAGLLARLDEPA